MKRIKWLIFTFLIMVNLGSNPSFGDRDQTLYGDIKYIQKPDERTDLNNIELTGWNGITFGTFVAEVVEDVSDLKLKAIDANTIYNKYWKVDFIGISDAVLIVDFDVNYKSYQLTVIKEYFPGDRFKNQQEVEKISNNVDAAYMENISHLLEQKYGNPSHKKSILNNNIQKSAWLFKNGYIFLSVDARYFVMTYGLKRGEHYEHMMNEFHE